MEFRCTGLPGHACKLGRPCTDTCVHDQSRMQVHVQRKLGAPISPFHPAPTYQYHNARTCADGCSAFLSALDQGMCPFRCKAVPACVCVYVCVCPATLVSAMSNAVHLQRY